MDGLLLLQLVYRRRHGSFNDIPVAYDYSTAPVSWEDNAFDVQYAFHSFGPHERHVGGHAISTPIIQFYT